MKIKNYYEKINKKSQEIFCESVNRPDLISNVHSAVNELFQLSTFISDEDERKMIQVVCNQLETSCLALTLGLYRPALATLRLAYELGIATVYFSANKLEHREWLAGISDLKWSCVNSSDDGVLSKRFAAAFFPALQDYCSKYHEKAQITYRCLSEYVHGNNETWRKSGIALARNETLINLYSRNFSEVIEVLKFAFCCRYLKTLLPEQIEDAALLLGEDFNHIVPIRKFLGGPEEIS